MVVAQLEVIQSQAGKFCSAQSAPKKKREDGVIPFVLCVTAGGYGQEPFSLVDGKPVAEPYIEALGSLDSPNACGQVWIEKSIVRPFKGKPSHCRDKTSAKRVSTNLDPLGLLRCRVQRKVP